MSEHASNKEDVRQSPDWYDRWLAEEAAMPHLPKRGGAVIKVFLFLAALAALVLLSDFSGNPASLCGACHTMQPYYYTWQASSHNQHSCLDCHAEPGLRGTARLMRDLARFSYVQATSSYVLPIRHFAGIDDEVCLRCHTFNRTTTATGDLIIPHADHSQGQVRCISCHDGVAHGNIGKRRTTTELPPADWNLAAGRLQMERAFTAVPKESCMSCHYYRRLELSCRDCHAEDKTPPDHLASDFLLTHGALTRETGDCYRCHGYDARGRRIEVKPGENLVAFTRRNDFCLDCHRLRPPSHEPDFRDHGPAAAGNEDSCMVCHDNQPQDMLPESSVAYCSSCHPAPHREGWQELHNRRRRGPVQIIPGQDLDESCFACHARQNCLSCHTFEAQNLSQTVGNGLPLLPQ